MSEAEMNNSRLTSMEEPGDECMAQIMREVAEEGARESTRRAADRVATGIEAANYCNEWREGALLNTIAISGIVERPYV